MSTDKPAAAAPLAFAYASASTSSTVCTHIAALDSQMPKILPRMRAGGSTSGSADSKRDRFKPCGSVSSRFSCSGVEATEGTLASCAGAAARFLLPPPLHDDIIMSTSPHKRCADAIRLDVNHPGGRKTTDIRNLFLFVFDSDTDRKKSYTYRREHWRVHTRTVPEHESIAMPL